MQLNQWPILNLIHLNTNENEINKPTFQTKLR